MEVTQEYGIDLLAIEEVRWTGNSVLEKKNCTVRYNCPNKQHCFGTGFFVSIRLRTRAVGLKPTDMKMCVLRIKGKLTKLQFYLCTRRAIVK
jgi:hypothetical protein